MVVKDVPWESEVDEADVAADTDANDDPALGNCGSGVRVVNIVSHAPSPSGLQLLSRSPRPSRRAARPRSRLASISAILRPIRRRGGRSLRDCSS
jgi:hypothetical protein